ncbi:HXXEE domain-containing protein [Clostridium estertheticum]|uniref:HXXEE domain-containing protein n=1 Tax=Clostridium estertheticum TaxID=238834 RepID=UPI001CF3D53B|nr:HXXEE domain-containing protein [Clostridium estertheticum]MCB2307382.1 HXXEE domain-containing protein [Clostridium estertheticum]MCB2345032.1 HXXEE domain-containing protein [Clostridium estertheticum]MCB2349808.1 HXXEE domain-containing protein [Clostridium estertheticum]WAG48265.1 HXXEE domain-containing protein [Clostridium estertheticum]
MDTMNFIVWMLPIIFMLHDFEEIIMAEVWGKRYGKAINIAWPKIQPFGLNYVYNCQTPTFSIGVEILFLFFSLISLFSIIFQNYFLWYGAFLGVTLHLVFIHMLICIRFKHYVPGVVTSIIFILPSIWFLYAANNILHYGTSTILLASLLGIILTLILMPALHKIMGSWSKCLYKYSQIYEK